MEKRWKKKKETVGEWVLGEQLMSISATEKIFFLFKYEIL